LTYLCAIGPTTIWQRIWDSAVLDFDWSLIADQSQMRLMATAGIPVLQDRFYISGVNGLWQIALQSTGEWQETALVTEQVLALTIDQDVNPPTLYYATANGVFSLDQQNQSHLVAYIDKQIEVISLLVVKGELWAGTAVHGILRWKGKAWSPEYTPPAMANLHLAFDELGLLTLAIKEAGAQPFNLPDGVELKAAVQLEFPLRPLIKVNNAYPCEAGSVILALLNNTQPANQVLLAPQISPQNTVSFV